jgi:dolichyl-phosphate-mannose-protein mannosyltransferase
MSPVLNSEQITTADVATREKWPHTPKFTRQTWVVLIVLVLVSAAYAGFYLKRGWVPHDEGAFALSAQRVLQGELPHRDFDEIYTGGLAFVNAGAMRAFGMTLVAMRYPLLITFLLWIVSLFVIGRRFASDYAAALACLLAVAAGIPNYSAAVPSWYNLFLATFGILTILRFMETQRWPWLFLAGLLGGMSFLIKVSGLYYVAAVLLFLLFFEQQTDRIESPPPRLSLFRYVVTLLSLIFVAIIYRTLASSVDARHLIYFLAPNAAVAGVLVAREFTSAYATMAVRFPKLLKWSAAFLGGVALPVGLFLTPYLRTGTLNTFVNGVFVVPFKRLNFAAFPPPALENLLYAIVLAGLLFWVIQRRRPESKIAQILLLIVFGGSVISSRFFKGPYHVLWHSMGLLLPVTVILFCILLLKRSEIVPQKQPVLFLLISTLAVCSLVQFPFSTSIYVLYIAPLLPVAWLALASTREHRSRFLLTTIAVAYIAFLVFCVTPGFLYSMGYHYSSNPETQLLDLPISGGIRVEPAKANQYSKITELIQKHARGNYIYAAPDCPEIYVLAGKQNPLPSSFDFLDDPLTRTSRVLAALDRRNVNAVAIFRTPSFSMPMDKPLRDELQHRYPQSEQVGSFQIRWRE